MTPMMHLLLLALGALGASVSDACSEMKDGVCESSKDADEMQSLQMSLLQTELRVSKSMPAIEKAKSVAHKTKSVAHKTKSIAHKGVAHAKHKQDPEEDASVVEASEAAAASGVALNAEGDLEVFICALITNLGALVFMCGSFMVLKGWYPRTYTEQLKYNAAPLNTIPEGTFGWIKAAWNAETSAVMESRGLDIAMHLEFLNLGMRLMAIIGLPMFCIMGPINCLFGGNAAGADYLSYFSFGNVEDGSSLYWIHAIIVWCVVFIVQVNVYAAQHNFMKYRYQWLRELPKNQANTVLVESIPPEYQSDDKLKGFFEAMFGRGSVSSAFSVKSFPALEKACAKKEATKLAIEKAKHSNKTYAVEEEELKKLEKEITTLQAELKAKSGKLGAEGYNASNGFVCFANRSDAQFALSAQFGEDFDEWVVTIPPEPNSILWADLQQGQGSRAFFTMLGYLLTAGLYLAYLPCVIWITQIATAVELGPLQPFWEAFAPTMGLQVMVAMLPTFLVLIFGFCFTLKAEVWVQQMLQNWYFIFNIVFVVLIVAISSGVVDFMVALVTSPMTVFPILGDSLPYATHFFLNYLALQWFSHGMVMTRYVSLTKYLGLKFFFDEDTAVDMSEPEDQDYYGIGSRSVRRTIDLTIGIVYGTMSPPMNLVCWMEFLVCRVLYGYLCVFAETKKADTGGAFWVQQMRHVFTANIIYCICMTGVLLGRAATNGPGLIAASSIFYVVWSMNKFERQFLWEKLSMKELMEGAQTKQKADDGEYKQAWISS